MSTPDAPGPDEKRVSSATDLHHQEASSEQDNTEYSVFSKPQVAGVVTLVALAGFFSPFTAFVYFPALQSISHDYGVSLESMNLTVTAYLLVQGIAPSILGDLSEGIGRRPVYLLCFIVYCIASLGLIFQRNYAALLVLRMLQSAGSSGTIALAYGVIGDIAAPHRRGVYVGLAHIGFNSAPGLGPVIGGLLADKVGWPWIFVFLSAFSGAVLILLALFLRETGRKIVDNGSLRPTGINRAILVRYGQGEIRGPENKPELRLPNIIPCFKIIFHKHTFPVLLANATFYMMYSVLQATLAPLLQRYYNLSPLEAGLCYLSFGCASPIASYALGRVTDRDYRVIAKKHNFTIDRRKGDDLLHFPIEEARIRTVFIYIALCATCTIGYGWTLERRTHLSAPLVLNFIIGFTVTGIFTVLNTLIVDVNPDSPATASSSVSITRCLTAAGGVAVIEVLINATGPGWAFTVVGGLCWFTVLVLLLVRRKGWEWRQARATTLLNHP